MRLPVALCHCLEIELGLASNSVSLLGPTPSPDSSKWTTIWLWTDMGMEIYLCSIISRKGKMRKIMIIVWQFATWTQTVITPVKTMNNRDWLGLKPETFISCVSISLNKTALSDRVLGLFFSGNCNSLNCCTYPFIIIKGQLGQKNKSRTQPSYSVAESVKPLRRKMWVAPQGTIYVWL